MQQPPSTTHNLNTLQCGNDRELAKSSQDDICQCSRFGNSSRKSEIKYPKYKQMWLLRLDSQHEALDHSSCGTACSGAITCDTNRRGAQMWMQGLALVLGDGWDKWKGNIFSLCCRWAGGGQATKKGCERFSRRMN